MSVALKLYEQLTEAGEDKTRARLIAEAFEHLEERYPTLKDVSTQSQVRETELRLQKEIKEAELRLQKEIEGVRLEVEGVRLEVKEVELRLQKEIESVRLEIGGVRLEIKEVEAGLKKELHALDVKIAETRADLIRWVVGMGLLQTSLITGVLLKVAHLI